MRALLTFLALIVCSNRPCFSPSSQPLDVEPPNTYLCVALLSARVSQTGKQLCRHFWNFTKPAVRSFVITDGKYMPFIFDNISIGHNHHQANKKLPPSYTQYINCWFSLLSLYCIADNGEQFITVHGGRPSIKLIVRVPR